MRRREHPARETGATDGASPVGSHRRVGQQVLSRRDDVRRVGQPGPRRVDPDHPRGARRRDQLHRHRRRLRAGRVRGDRRQGARRRPARRRHPRHQVPQRDGRGPQPAGQLAPLDHPRGRGLAAAVGHRLDRPLPGPPPRSAHGHRGDAVGAQRPRAPGQGPLHRPLHVPRQPHRRGAMGRARPRPPAVRHRAAAVLGPRPRRRGRRPAHVLAARHGRHVLQPADRRLAVRPLAQGHRAAVLLARRAGCPSASISHSPPTSASSTPSSTSRSSPTRRASR